jgi:hypothetical protein
MQFLSVSTLVLSLTLFSGAASLNTLVERGLSGDYCGEVHANLRVPHAFSPGKKIDCGKIRTRSLDAN